MGPALAPPAPARPHHRIEAVAPLGKHARERGVMNAYVSSGRVTEPNRKAAKLRWADIRPGLTGRSPDRRSHRGG
jgi:hypothetical protein